MLPRRKEMEIGTAVVISTRVNGVNNPDEGVISEILTNRDTHTYGIKVKLESGAIGRVQKIVEGFARTYCQRCSTRCASRLFSRLYPNRCVCGECADHEKRTESFWGLDGLKQLWRQS